MKTFLRVCAWSFLALVVLVVGLYLFLVAQRSAEVADHKERAVAELTEAMPTGQEIAATERERVLRRLDAEPAAYAWQELQCRVDGEESGWLTMYYQQECWLRTVDLVPSGKQTDRACTGVSPRWGRPELTSSVDVHRGPAESFDQENSYDLGCPAPVLGAYPGVTTRLLDGERPDDLTGSPDWLVVQVDTPLTQSMLDCNPWRLMFCDSPVDGPVLPDDL